MSDDSDFDDVAHEKLLQSIKTPGSIKENKVKKSKKGKVDAEKLLSQIKVSRVSVNEARKSMGIQELDVQDKKEETSKTGKKRVAGDGEKSDTPAKKKNKKKTLVPVKDIEARKRAEGELGFTDLRKDMTRNWSQVVQSNRIADQLIFPLNQPECLLLDNEKKKVKLTEKELAIKKATDIKLAKEKLNQMQRMRAIIGIQDAKNRYMNKIKSKGYHRILKREKRKQLLKEFDDLVTRDPKAAHEKLAELDLQRIMERGSLKHRGQNQKFKQMLEKHASRNPEVKKLLEEHLRMGRELKQKVADGEQKDDDEDSKDDVEEKTKSIHEILQDSAREAANEKESVAKKLVDSFLDDSEAQKLSLAEMRAQKRREAAANSRNLSVQDVSEPIFDVEKEWSSQNEDKKKKKKQKNNGSKKQGTINKRSYVDSSYDPSASELTFEEKLKIAVDEAGVNDEEKKRKQIAIDPRKFLELNTNDLTQVSSELVDKMEEYDEEAANVINEAFKDDDVVGEFEVIKDGVKEKEKQKDIDLNLAGWGSWVGPGTTEKKRRKRFIIKAKEKIRKDGERNGLIVKESISASEGIGKIRPNVLPFPYTRVEDYETVLKQPLGLEWNMEKMRDELCKPAVVIESGRAIRPINKKDII